MATRIAASVVIVSIVALGVATVVALGDDVAAQTSAEDTNAELAVESRTILDARDDSDRSALHEVVHPVYRNVVDRLDLFDLVLVDDDGRGASSTTRSSSTMAVRAHVVVSNRLLSVWYSSSDSLPASWRSASLAS